MTPAPRTTTFRCMQTPEGAPAAVREQAVDRNGLTVLSREESLALLASKRVGRISVTMRALPTILPVTYVLDAKTESIVFRTGYGTKLYAAGRNSVVAFEIDEIDEATRTGWSVVAIGTASEVTDRQELDRLAQLPLLPWVKTTEMSHTIAIPIVHLAGRRLTGS